MTIFEQQHVFISKIVGCQRVGLHQRMARWCHQQEFIVKQIQCFNPISVPWQRDQRGVQLTRA